MTLTKQQGIVLVTEQQAAATLLADGFLQVPCDACDRKGYWTLGEPPAQSKFKCDRCDGEKWTWQSPPAKNV